MTSASRAGRAASLLVTWLLALVFGIALTMSFAPTGAWWFAPYCVTGVLLLLGATGLRAFGVGFFFGLGWFGAGFWWILPALDSFSDAGPLFSFQLTAALVIYMSLFPACAAVLMARCRQTAQPGLSGRVRTGTRMALIFAVAEWARGNLLGGFPMLATGYAHTEGALAGFTPLVGVYGVGFLNSWIAALIATACWQTRAQQTPRLWIETAALVAALAAGGLMLQTVDWAHDTGKTLSVSLLQGNQAQADKFSEAGFARAATTYLEMAALARGQLTVLPETALPLEWSAMPPAVAARFQDVADARRTTLLIGAVKYDAAASGGALMNSALALFPGQTGGPGYRYDKHHLVPFAESLPPGTAWIGQRLGLDINGLTPGPAEQAPLQMAGARVGVTICFEDLFDTAVAARARNADVMLNLTNFAWFAGSYAPAQHLQVARMRAMETARWFVQVSNTGMTAIIDAKGVVRQQLRPDQTGILEGQVHLTSANTPFMLLGNWPLLIAAALASIGAMRAGRRGHRTTS